MAIEWLKKLLETATVTDGVLDAAALESALEKALARHTVPKETYAETEGKLKTATAQLDALAGEDVAQLRADLETERAGRVKDRQTYQLRAALERAGAADADYLLYKLSDSAKFDKDGRLEDEAQLVKAAREAHPALFQTGQAYSPAGGAAAVANPWKPETFNLTQQGEIFKRDPAQAREWMAAAGVAAL